MSDALTREYNERGYLAIRQPKHAIVVRFECIFFHFCVHTFLSLGSVIIPKQNDRRLV